MTPWTLSGPDRRAGAAPRPVTQARPLDPLPPRLDPTPPTPVPARLPPGAGLLVVAVLVVGSPWVNEVLTQWQYDLARGESGFVGIVTGLTAAVLA